MIKNGARPTRIDHRDFSHKSFGSVQVPFPPSYDTDAHLDMPNQDADGLPYGCTDEAQADNANDLAEKSIALPWTIEAVTRANANGGADIRVALKAAISLGWITAFYNIEAIGQDIFDAARDAMISGGTEKRSVSVGSKWFSEFEGVTATGIMPMPDFNGTFTWHNWSIKGWETINDQVYLKCKSWQGPNYGNQGYAYISRPLFNQLMSISGSAAFTATRGVLPPVSTITVTFLQWLKSWAYRLKPY